MGKFDSAEFVLLDGLQKIPDNIELRKRLAYAYKRQGKVEKEIIEYERLADMSPEDIQVLNDLNYFIPPETREQFFGNECDLHPTNSTCKTYEV